jgi:hypothetical protein
MRINFRHGIVQYTVDQKLIPTYLLTTKTQNTVDLAAVTDKVLFTIAHNDVDYLYEERDNIQRAWGPFIDNMRYWMYIDLDTRTGKRTTGATELKPIVSDTEPTKITDQHWFDLTRTCMYVYDGVHWVEKLRVFVGEYYNHDINFEPLGSQVGLHNSIDAGFIIYSDADTPSYRARFDGTGKFLTSDTNFAKTNSVITTVNLQSDYFVYKAFQDIPNYRLVYSVGDGTVGLASYDDINYHVAIGLVELATTAGDYTNILTNGIVSNPAWQFTTASKFVYLGLDGNITEIPPKYGFIQKVGYVISTDTIYLNINYPIIKYDNRSSDLNTVPVGFNFGKASAGISFTNSSDYICSTIYGVFGNKYYQPIPNDVWVLKHTSKLRRYLVQAYDSDNNLIVPDTIKTINDTTIEVSFTKRLSGFARLFLF